jgi:hypothetical protein
MCFAGLAAIPLAIAAMRTIAGIVRPRRLSLR